MEQLYEWCQVRVFARENLFCDSFSTKWKILWDFSRLQPNPSLSKDKNQLGAEGPATREMRSEHNKSRRAALITETSEHNGSVDIKRKLEKVISEKTHTFVLHPHSSFRFYWDMISIVVLMINVVTIPLGWLTNCLSSPISDLSFYLESPNINLQTIKFLTDIWFILDMMLNFRTGIFTYRYVIAFYW